MDRRLYKRVPVSLLGDFILRGSEADQREFDGVIQDVSEGGIKFCVNGAEYPDLISAIQVGSKILFQSLDEYVFFKERRTDVFHGEVEVVRAEDIDGRMIFGCRMTKLLPDFANYVKHKKLSLFLESGCAGL